MGLLFRYAQHQREAQARRLSTDTPHERARPANPEGGDERGNQPVRLVQGQAHPGRKAGNPWPLKRKVIGSLDAEAVGFEPTTQGRVPDSKSGALGHSATPPFQDKGLLANAGRPSVHEPSTSNVLGTGTRESS